MPVTTDIVATYRGPGRVVRRLLDMGQREDRALAFLMAACGLTFLSQLPVLSRKAHLEQVELNPLLGASLLSWLFLAPLLFYGLAALAHVVARMLGGRGSFWAARLATFWALLASSPLILFNGLVGGFIGKGAALNLVGFVWFAVFMWFWIRGLMVAESGEPS